MTLTVQDVLNLAQTSNLRLVRFLFCDTSSIIRGKVTHADSLKDRMETGIGLVKGTMAMNLLDQMQTQTGFGATGEIRLLPDPSTFRVLPYDPGSAAMLCDLMELDHRPWALCPRGILKSQIELAARQDVFIHAAFEPEFVIGTGTHDELEPIDRGLCFSTESMGRAADFISTFVDALSKQNIEVEQYYPELGPGQHEVSIRHAAALDAADRHLMYRETLRGVAISKQLQASLAPKPFADQAGNGCHLHVSTWDGAGKNRFYNQGELSQFGRHFVAGLLEHLPGLVALTCSSVNSYRRLQPNSWSSAFACWGYENREAAVRVPSVYWGKEQASTNLEIKCVDSSSNPYIALTGVIAAGLDGVNRKLEPPEPVDVNPGTLSDEERLKHGMPRLPTSLKEALAELEKDKCLLEAVGNDYARTFMTVKASECAQFALHDPQFELRHHRMKF